MESSLKKGNYEQINCLSQFYLHYWLIKHRLLACSLWIIRKEIMDF